MDCVLVGARDEAQTKDNVKALDFKLSETKLKMMRDAAVKLVLSE